MNKIKFLPLVAILAFISWSCDQQEVGLSSDSIEQLAIDVAQTSGQLASGASFSIAGSSTDSTDSGHKGRHHRKGGKHPGLLDGLNLLAPTDELLAIVDAESASDIRGLRISKNGGATITHYNASGETVTVSLPGKNGPQGCSFSGKQYPEYDSLLSSIVKTVVDFGTGTTFQRDTIEIVRAGKIIIERSKSGTTVVETTTFEDYSVNGIKIEGTKTRTSTFDETTGSGSSNTTVANGKITLADGTVAIWTSEKTRTSDFVMEDGRPVSGTIVTNVNTQIVSGTDVIYSHQSTTPLTEDIECRRVPVSGVLETVYRTNDITIEFGDGSCANRTITITVNGTTTTKTIGS